MAITRKVVRSKRITSVALHAAANVDKCLDRMAAFGIKVCTIFDHAFLIVCRQEEQYIELVESCERTL